MESLGVETTKTMPDNFELILECMERQARALEENRDALLLLDRRIEMLDSSVRGVADSVQTIAKRQSELESSSEKRHGTCADIMKVLTERITAIENEKTPIPRQFTTQEFSELYMVREQGSSDKNNGTGDGGLPLAELTVDDGKDGEDE